METENDTMVREVKDMPQWIFSSPILKTIWKNIHQEDLTELGIIVGRTGVGKTCSAYWLSVALDCYKNREEVWQSGFAFSKSTFRAYNFVEMITRQRESKKQSFRKGSCFIFDEANIEASNLDFQTVREKAVVRALQTTRKYNYVVLMTTPDWASIGKAIRRRATFTLELKDKVVRNGKPFVKAKFSWIEYNNKTGDEYPKRHRASVLKVVDRKDDGTPVVQWRRQKYVWIYVPKIPDWIEDKANELKDIALAQDRSADLAKLRMFLGEQERERKAEHSLEDLKKLFYKEKTEKVDWEKVLHNEKLSKELVESAICDFDSTVKAGDIGKIFRWLKAETIRKEIAEKELAETQPDY